MLLLIIYGLEENRGISQMKIFTNSELDKIELSLTFCKFLKKYYTDLYALVFGIGDGADYTFVRKFYAWLDNKDSTRLKRFYDILEYDMIATIEELDDNQNPNDVEQVKEIEYFLYKLKEYI